MHGDCLARMSEIPDASVDLVLADPPFGTTRCKWDEIIDLDAMWKEVKRVIKPNGAMVFFGSQPFTTVLIASNIKQFKYPVVWVKNKSTNFLNAKRQVLRRHEDILVFYDGQCTYNPQMTTGHAPVNSYTKHAKDGESLGATKQGLSGGGSTERYPTSVLEMPVVNQVSHSEPNVHPTQKPVALMEYLIKTYSNEGETVLDFAAGSMSTAVACINTKRSCIMIEKDENYFNVGRDRVIKAMQDNGISR